MRCYDATVKHLRGKFIEQADVKSTLVQVERQQVIKMWVGGSFATLGIVALLGMLTNAGKHQSNLTSGAIMAVLMFGLGSRAWWANFRKLTTTRRALLFLTQPCHSTLQLHVLTVRLQQLTIDVPLTDKVATALAQHGLAAATPQ